MTRARNSANLASHGNLFVDIANDRTGIGSVVPDQNLHVAGTAGFHADTTFTGDLYNATWDRSDNTLKFVENAKLKFGDQFSIYKSSSHAIIDHEFQSGSYLRIGSANGVIIGSPLSHNQTLMRGYVNGAAELYYAGAKKLETTTYGTNTTGTAVNDGLVVAGVATVTTMNVTGVLTYDDVTSIDSIGIITARSNIDCNGNLDVAGTSNFVGDATFNGGAGAVTIPANSDMRFINGTWSGDVSGNVAKIQHHSNILYISGGSSGIYFRENNANRWFIADGGHFISGADSTYDIGTSGNRVRNGYFDTLYGDGSNLTGIDTDLVSDTSPQLGGDLDVNNKKISFPDSVYSGSTIPPSSLRFGDNDDLILYHTGNYSGIDERGGGNGGLVLHCTNNFTVKGNASNKNRIIAKEGGAVELYYNGAKTLETTVNALHLFGNAHECNIDFKIDNGNRVGFIGITNSGRVQINGAASGNPYETYLEGNLNGAVKLFYDDSVRIETLTEGAKIKRHSGGATTLYIEGAEGSTAILDMFADDGDDNADKFRLQASTDGTFLMQNYASGGWETNIRTVGNGAVDLYHDNSVRFTTKSTGFEASGGSFTFYGAEGGASQLLIYADEGDDLNDRWRVMAGGSNDFIIGNLADASWDTSIKAYGDAGVHLYYNDNERLRTIGGGNSADGINVFGNASNSAVRMSTSDGTLRGILYANSSNLIGFLGNNGNWALSVENAGGNTVSYNNFNPSSGNSLDLGSSSAHWRRLYTGGITVSDNGVSDEIFKLRADDQSPWLFNLGNDTYHSTNGGLWGYQANNGDFYLRYRGNSEYKSFYIQRWNGSTSNLVAHFDYYGRFGGYYQNTLALQTAVDGIDVFAGADNQNGEIRIRARGTAVYSTLSFYSAAGASVGSVGTHSGAATIYYIAANSGSHLFHFGGAYKLHLTSSTVKPQTGVTLDLGSSADPYNDLFIKNGTCSGTGAFKVSAGTTAQRPTGANGQLRYNSTLNILEGYINGAWTKVKGTGLAESGSYANNTQAIADDLYAYWSCDSTSTTRDGGDSGSATLYGVSSSSGKISNSWDRGTAAANGMNLTSMPTGNNWTLMFWLYLSSNTIHSTSDGAGILWLDSTQAGSVILGYDGSNGNNLRFGGNGWVSDGEVVYSSFGTTGVWRHMVITNNSNSWKFYLDGSLITTRSESLNNNGNWWLANYSRHGGNTNNHYFRGRLDEIAIWHRTLSAGEISETYNAQSTSATQLVP